jgi:tetratricopeptide (TPR) repeat protein
MIAEGSEASGALRRGTSLGRYLILEPVGAGAMGVVYAAYDPQLDRKVALKILRESAFPGPIASEGRERLLREARAMARLSHPNVVAVFDAGVVGEQVFIAMEFVEGLTLRRWLGERPRLTGEVLHAFVEAGRGLSAAHAAGLVHRDVKPDNVLVDLQGRVRVTDFGLARAAPEAFGPPSPELRARLEIVPPALPGDSGPSDWVNLTKYGTLAGTPAYMAPEQIAGRGADHRSDQFSFCVALHEALFHELPFEGESPEAVVFAIAMNRLRPLPKGPVVPAWIAPVLRRGMAANPEDRHPDMQALLAALSRDPARARRRWLVAGAASLAAAAVASAFALYAARSPGPVAACRASANRMALAWSSERRSAMESAFLATGLPYARDAAKGVASILQRYVEGLQAMSAEACEAVRVRGEQSERILLLRNACLERRLDELTKLVDLLSKADAKIVERAVGASQELRGVEGCADLDGLTARAELPPDPQKRRAVEELRGRLAEAKALLDLGSFPRSLELATAAAAAAKELGYAPAMAEALNLRGDAEARIRDPKTAEGSHYEAIAAAEAGHDDLERARGWVRLVRVVGRLAGRHEEALRIGALAEAVVARLGRGREALLSELLANRAWILLEQGHHVEAAAAFRSALDVRRAASLPQDRADANALNGLAAAVNMAGAWAESLEYFRQALAILEGIYGPSHPDLIAPLGNASTTFLEEGKLSEAQSWAERALRIRDAVFGNEVQQVSPIFNMSLISYELGKFDEAVSLARRAVDLQSAAPESADLAYAHVDLALVLTGRKEADAATSEARRALALAEKLLGKDHPFTATALTMLGVCAHERRAFAEALPLYRRALEIRERAFGKDHFTVALTLVEMGRALVAVRQYAEAIPGLERALKIRKAIRVDPCFPAETAFLLAQALWETGRDRAEALRLARDAREGFARSESFRRREVASVDAWLAGKSDR